MQRHLKIPLRKIVIAVSQLNQELSKSLIPQLIQPSASYQIIPGFLQTMNYQIDGLLIALLAYSENRLIDVCLPHNFIRNSKSHRVLARYILLNKKLWGIKLCRQSQNKQYQTQNLPPPISVQQYYRKNNINFSMNEVLVGHFYLQLHNCRICLIFESELIHNRQILQIYNRYRCDVYSVINNIQRDFNRGNYSLKSNIAQQRAIKSIQDFARLNNVTMVYTGLKIIQTPNCVYWTNSFIQQGNQKCEQPSLLLGHIHNTVFLCDLQLTLRNRVILIDEDQLDSSSDVIFEALYINQTLRYSNNLNLKQENPQPHKKYLDKLEGIASFTLLNLWYLFCTVNQYTPFVISLPFTFKTKQLYDYLNSLSEHSLLQLKDYINIYSAKLEQHQNITDIKISNSIQELLESKQENKLIYLYTDDAQQIRRLKLNKNHTKSICFCEPLLPILDQHQKATPKVAITAHFNNKKIENACTHVLKQRYQTIDEMLLYFTKLNFNRIDIERSFLEIIPNKIRKYFKLIPLYVFLLHGNCQQIINEIGQAELRLKNHQQQTTLLQYDQSKILLQRIEDAKNYKNKLSTYSKCHKCDISFKKQLVYTCNNCQNSICYDCIDQSLHHNLLTIESYKCLICQRNCNCSKCNVKQRPLNSSIDTGKTQTTSKLSIFNTQTFSCSFCQILGNPFSSIRIECTQCKQLKCYHCQKSYKSAEIVRQRDWVCKDCDQFNLQIAAFNSNKIQSDNIASLASMQQQVQQNHQIDNPLASSELLQLTNQIKIAKIQNTKENHKIAQKQTNMIQNQEQDLSKYKYCQHQENKLNLDTIPLQDQFIHKPICNSSQMISQQQVPKSKNKNSRSRSRQKKSKHKKHSHHKKSNRLHSKQQRSSQTATKLNSNKEVPQHNNPNSSISSPQQLQNNQQIRKQQKQQFWLNKNTKPIWSRSANQNKVFESTKNQSNNKTNPFKHKSSESLINNNTPKKQHSHKNNSLIFPVPDHSEEEHSY